MIKRICDSCGEEIKKEFINFNIVWNKAEAISGEGDKYNKNTPYLEYCEICFNNLLETLGLDKE